LLVLKSGDLIKKKKINGIILAGDFNFPDIIWERTGSPEKIVPRQVDKWKPEASIRTNFINSVNDSGLYQNIDFKTFIGTLKRDTLDLVFTDKECSEVVQDKYLGNPFRGHIGISWKYEISIKICKSNTANLCRINKDWLRIKEKMDEKFKIITIAYDELCRYSAELQSVTEKENAVNIG